MPHVHEGQLHAYLDGALASSDPQLVEIEAHLAGCADCRARLERERALHADANAILARAVPRSAAMPSFEEIAARSAARQQTVAPPAKHGISYGRLALAASLVLAMGGALLTTAIVRKNFPEEAAMLQAPAASNKVSAPAQESAPLAAEAEPSVAGQVAQAPAAPPPPAQKPTQNRADVRRDREARTSDFSGSGVGSIAATAPAAAPAASAPPPPAPPPSVAAAPGFTPAEKDESKVGAEGAQNQQLAARDAAANAAAAGARARVAAERWLTVDRAEAERRLGTKLLVVPGLAVRSFAVSAETDKRTVRVMQALPNGAVVEFFEQPHDMPARSLERAATARDEISESGLSVKGAAEAKKASAPQSKVTSSEVTVVRGAVQIQARGAVPPDSLRALLERAN